MGRAGAGANQPGGGVMGRANRAGAGSGSGPKRPALPTAPRAALLAGKAAPAAAALLALAPALCSSCAWAPAPCRPRPRAQRRPSTTLPLPFGGGRPGPCGSSQGALPLPQRLPAELAGAPNFASSLVVPAGREPAHLRSGREPGDGAHWARAGAPPLGGAQRVGGNSRSGEVRRRLLPGLPSRALKTLADTLDPRAPDDWHGERALHLVRRPPPTPPRPRVVVAAAAGQPRWGPGLGGGSCRRVGRVDLPGRSLCRLVGHSPGLHLRDRDYPMRGRRGR